ncbi:MAG TPA: MFS transporter [Actinophytocola sp.]|uniref:MFS transporter n=1 Tax=Actinophytocola sp. TaxID=1872138 RepID=UPI002DDD98C5|nr:MFS transporter [Actinophytocola sp.]HEV2782556.1 MFS transporter [Actinophytocola sp.]
MSAVPADATGQHADATGQHAGSRWSAVAAYALVAAATQLLWLSFAGVSTVAAGHYGVSETAIGWLAQVFPLLYVVLAVPAGLVLDRWFRGGLLAGAGLTAAGAVLRLAGDDFLWVLAGQAMVAVAQPLVLNAVIGVTGRYLAAPDRPAGIAIGTAGTISGMVLAFVLAAVFPEAGDLTTMLGIGAAFAIAAAVALGVALRVPGRQPHTRPPAGLGALRIAWADRFVRRLCVLVFLPFGTFIALTTFAQPLLEPAGVSGATASVLLLINVVAGVIGCAVVPVIAARRRIELTMLVVGVSVAAAGCAVLAAAPGAASGFTVLLLIGFLLLPTLPVVLALTERRAGPAEGTAAGLIWLSGNLGGLVVATVVGLLVDHPAVAFLVMAAGALAALPLVGLLRPFLRARLGG